MTKIFTKQVVVALVLFLVAAVLRWKLLGFVSDDMKCCLIPWHRHIMDYGFADALKSQFTDYNFPYLYLLSIATLLPFSQVISIKFVSILFELLILIPTCQLLKFTSKSTNNIDALIKSLFILLLPTVLLNSAYWGQCDVVYVFFNLISVLFLFKKNYRLAIIFFSIAFSIKPQAVFLLPVFFILFIKKKITLLEILIAPISYLTVHLPNYLIGTPLKDIFFNVPSQIAGNDFLSANAPNFFIFFPYYHPVLKYLGWAFTLIASVSSSLWLANRVKLYPRNLSRVVLFFSLLLPLLLPQMHERYFFFSDIFSLLNFYLNPQDFVLVILLNTASLFSYFPYLFSSEPLPLTFLAMLNIAASLLIFFKLNKSATGDEKLS